MTERKEWKGIQVNFSIFQGTIIEDPVISGDHIFMKLKTANKGFDPNGQFTETEQIVPLMVEPNGPKKVVTDHVAAGRKLLAWTTYKSWVSNGAEYHAFVVKSIDLGSKPYTPPENHTPPLPA